MNEQQIINNIKKDPKQAQKQIYQAYRNKMFGVCLRYAKNNAEAEDFLHDAFIKAFKVLDTYNEKGSFEGWLRRIFVSSCVDTLRKQKLQFSSIDDLHMAQDIADEQLDTSSHNIQQVIALIQKMPEGYRLVFNLFHIEGYSHNEIATMLNIKVSTSTTQLLRAKKWLSSKLNTINELQYA